MNFLRKFRVHGVLPNTIPLDTTQQQPGGHRQSCQTPWPLTDNVRPVSQTHSAPLAALRCPYTILWWSLHHFTLQIGDKTTRCLPASWRGCSDPMGAARLCLLLGFSPTRCHGGPRGTIRPATHRGTPLENVSPLSAARGFCTSSRRFCSNSSPASMWPPCIGGR